MRVSANAGDRDFWRRHAARSLVIRLDCVAVYDVLEADDCAGFVVCFARDGAGRLIRAQNGREFLTRRLEGRVEILVTQPC